MGVLSAIEWWWGLAYPVALLLFSGSVVGWLSRRVDGYRRLRIALAVLGVESTLLAVLFVTTPAVNG